jgi:quercetin dioxygenase-like cupin family protein
VKLHIWNEIPAEALSPRMTRKVIHSERLTIARLSLARGAVVPQHAHEHEQVTTVLSGRLQFQLDGRELELGAGESLEIPPFVAHGVTALEDSDILDLFAPRREDWISGDDDYLRSPR